mmetsp:Transcript_39508/g.101404  ORF Transcript_39508/g.101404 Transcript_39508/m.101404 type:complete len:212 (-) Transcript_39508:854-1489(-)
MHASRVSGLMLFPIHLQPCAERNSTCTTLSVLTWGALNTSSAADAMPSSTVGAHKRSEKHSSESHSTTSTLFSVRIQAGRRSSMYLICDEAKTDLPLSLFRTSFPLADMMADACTRPVVAPFLMLPSTTSKKAGSAGLASDAIKPDTAQLLSASSLFPSNARAVSSFEAGRVISAKQKAASSSVPLAPALRLKLVRASLSALFASDEYLLT